MIDYHRLIMPGEQLNIKFKSFAGSTNYLLNSIIIMYFYIPVWLSIVKSTFVVFVSQIFTKESSPPVTTLLQSGENATVFT